MSRPDLGARIAGLRDAVGAIDEAAATDSGLFDQVRSLDGARAVLTRVGRRRELSADHVVVALAGATGSGKSSLMNALVGAAVTRPGARRPTTSHPLAVVYGSGAGAGPLLDWLEVGERVQRTDRPEREGLILLDLPDIDSINPEHRRRAERLAGTVDVLVWVLDPQKYADAVVHEDFLAPMARHAEVTVVVLNQVDRLAAADRAPVLTDLRGRLAEDGLPGVTTLAVSARTGEGLERLDGVLADFVRRRKAVDARLGADIGTAAAALAAEVPAGATTAPSGREVRRLEDALAAAAGAGEVADAVAGAYRHRARGATGWPVTRWLRRFKPDPLRRLGLAAALPAGRKPERRQLEAEPAPELRTSSLDARIGPAQRARAGTALRDVADAATSGTGEPWRTWVRAGATGAAAALPDALDRAVVATPLGLDRTPRWWRAVGAVQWVVFAAAVLGALWLGAYALAGYLRIPFDWVPVIGPVPARPPLPELPAIPWPTVLLAGGALLGLLTALIAGLAARVGANRRSARARAALRKAVGAVAKRDVLDPLAARAALVRRYADGLAVAVGR